LNEKVLVLGSTGLIGHQIYKYLIENSKYTVIDISYRKKFTPDSYIQDARFEEDFINRIYKIKPKYIINCIGVLIQQSIDNIENAIYLNSYLPHRLARLADVMNAKLVHISTDCVFSGKKGTSYIETDYKDGESNYAKTKSLGEIIDNNHLTIRTSVLGPELKKNGEELFNWFMSENDEIFGYTKDIWSGVSSFELAKATCWFLDKDITGLYHLTNNSSISKFDILELLNKYTKKEIRINPIDGNNLNKSFLDTRGLIDYLIPSYDQMIFEMVRQTFNESSIYPHYRINSLDVKK